MSVQNLRPKENEVGSLIEQVVINGDLNSLSPIERVNYYKKVCESLGLNYLTKPFRYIVLNGKLALYAEKNCTEQLRKIHQISIEVKAREVVDDLYIVTAWARDKSGREDESMGAVSLAGLKGEARANAVMKAETKAKRRVTLSITGLGMLDETEVSSIPNAIYVPIDYSTGEIIDHNKIDPASNDEISPLELKKLKDLIIRCNAEQFMKGLLKKYNVNRVSLLPKTVLIDVMAELSDEAENVEVKSRSDYEN